MIYPTTYSSSNRADVAVDPYFYTSSGTARENILTLQMVKETDEAGNAIWRCVIHDGGSFDGQTSETNPVPTP